MGADHLHAVLSSSLRMLLSDLQLVAVTTTSREDSDEVTVIVRGRPQPRLTAKLGTPIEEARAALSSPPEPVEPPPWVRPPQDGVEIAAAPAPADPPRRAYPDRLEGEEDPTSVLEQIPTDPEMTRLLDQLGPTEGERRHDPLGLADD